MPKRKNKVVCLVGPTAVGKSKIACLLAKKINGQIISADSMQVYKNLPILTNCPSLAMRQSVPHHLVSIIDLTEEFNVAKFVKLSGQAIKQVFNDGGVPVITGGSGLYINAILDGIFLGPGQDAALRKRLEKQAQKNGKDYLFRRLKELDPQAASKIHPNNLQRVIRALEVCIKTGKKMSEIKKNRKGIWTTFDVRFIGLKRERNELYDLINSRVDMMFRQGAAREVKDALKVHLSKTAGQIIGIKEIAGYFKKEYNKDEAKRLLKRNSRHLAKRQMTWFGRDKRIKWLEIKGSQKAKYIVDRILKLI